VKRRLSAVEAGSPGARWLRSNTSLWRKHRHQLHTSHCTRSTDVYAPPSVTSRHHHSKTLNYVRLLRRWGSATQVNALPRFQQLLTASSAARSTLLPVPKPKSGPPQRDHSIRNNVLLFPRCKIINLSYTVLFHATGDRTDRKFTDLATMTSAAVIRVQLSTAISVLYPATAGFV
jgi:hypothetical protein